MYKPGNESTPLPMVAPHQPRLDWQMWFAAQGPYSQSPWFVSLVHRLLQGSRSGEWMGGLAIMPGTGPGVLKSAPPPPQ